MIVLVISLVNFICVFTLKFFYQLHNHTIILHNLIQVMPPDQQQSDSFFSVNQLVNHKIPQFTPMSSNSSNSKKASKRSSLSTVGSNSGAASRYHKQSRTSSEKIDHGAVPNKKETEARKTSSSKTQSRSSTSARVTSNQVILELMDQKGSFLVLSICSYFYCFLK